MSFTGKCHPIVTRGSRVSRALSHHTLPAFVNLNGSYMYRCFMMNLLFSDQRAKEKALNKQRKSNYTNITGLMNQTDYNEPGFSKRLSLKDLSQKI